MASTEEYFWFQVENNDASEKEMYRHYLELQEQLEDYKTNKEALNDDRYDKDIEQAEKELALLEQSFIDQGLAMKYGLEANTEQLLIGLGNMISQASGKKYEFKELGDGTIQAYLDGIAIKEPVAQENFKTFATSLMNELDLDEDAEEKAKNLLAHNGVIFISIDDHELFNLKKLCDEIFGENNFVANLVWQKNFAPKNDNKYISMSTEYVLVYAKSKEKFNRGLLPREEKHNKGYNNPDNDPRGLWTSGSMLATTYSSSGVYEIIAPNGKKHLPPAGRCWRFTKDTIEHLKMENKIWFGTDGNGVPRIKRFLSEMPNGIVPQNLMLYTEVGSNQDGNLELRELFDAQIFDYPKNTKLLNRIFTIANVKENDIVLDFFSGSATTAQALFKKNAKENSNIKFILIQIEERYSDKSGKYNFEIICDLGEERIRRAGKKIKEETNANIDYGFRVYKIDSSNMKDVYYKPSELNQEQLNLFETNIKEDRASEDLLTQVILDLGLTLDLKIEEKNILGNKVYFVDSNSLIACFDENLDINIVDEICEHNPLKVVFKDSSFKNDNDKINVEEKIKKQSPDTEINIL